jgi:histidinol dehydrogenase
VRRFDAARADFDASFEDWLAADRGAAGRVEGEVAEIIAEIRAEGLAALLRLTARFDGIALGEDALAVSRAEIDAGFAACPADVRAAIAFAAARIRAYHEKLKPTDGAFTDEAGISLGWRWTPLDAVGIYVPGGRAAYPSTVLMNAIPAKLAGVARIAMVTPAGRLSPAVLAAAREAGVDEIWRVGGAQAVAALAYGAGPIRPVDKIVGPGNAYVTAAKRAVFGQVGIDSLAGPSEVVVVADADNDPEWMAADLLSQAEHDPDARPILITDDSGFADAVEAAIARQLVELATAETARRSIAGQGAAIIAPRERVAALIDRIAPEHLQLAVEAPEALAAKVRHAGAIFLGRYAPEAIGDYVAGPNHVLPTAGSARFSSGLSTADFLKRTSMIACSEQGFAALAPAARALAEAEGLPAHARSLSIRGR